MIRLEEDLVARRVRHSREIVRRTARALKREGLTLASLRFRSGDEFTGQEGKHEVVKGSLRPRDAVGSGEDGVSLLKFLAPCAEANILHVFSNAPPPANVMVRTA